MAQQGEAAAVQLAQDRADLITVMTNTCNFTANQRTCLTNDGYDTAQNLVGWKFNKIREWCEKKSALRINMGGCAWGDRTIKCIQGLAWWCTERSLRGKRLDVVTVYHNDEQLDAIEESELDYEELKKESNLDKPEKFKTEKMD